ncbi:PIR protein, putative [Plasmodium sp.]|nr:PIR protein, putative [Plasmodium sp.]
MVNSPKNPCITSLRPTTKPKNINRNLCECDLYTSIYDNDPEMKKLMDNFERQTLERFRKNQERSHVKRQKCKEQCDKDIRAIILKDKIHKELTEKFAILETNININDIPTCVCEKSLFDKIEKSCLKCGYGLGSNVPLLGLISGIVFYTWALDHAAKVAVAAGNKAALKSAIVAFEETIKKAIISASTSIVKDPFSPLLHGEDAANVLVPILSAEIRAPSSLNPAYIYSSFLKVSSTVEKTNQISHVALNAAGENLLTASAAGAKAYNQVGSSVAEYTKQVTFQNIFTFETFFSSSLGISIIVILCIVITLFIIYLILNYSRKKKIKKKVNYIKLLNS